MADSKVWLVWNRDSFVWNKVTLSWEDAFVIDLLGGYKGGAPSFLLDKKNPWKSLDDDLAKNGAPEEVRDKLLEVIIRVNGLDKKVTRLFETTNPTITVDHIQKTIAASGRIVKVTTDKGKII